MRTTYSTSVTGWAIVLPIVAAVAITAPRHAEAYDFTRLQAVPSSEDKPPSDIANRPTTDRVVLGRDRYVHILLNYRGVSRRGERAVVTCTLYGPDGRKIEDTKTIRDRRYGEVQVQVPRQVRHEVNLSPSSGEAWLAGFGPFEPGYKLDRYSIECVSDDSKMQGPFRLDSMTIEELKAMGQRSVGLVVAHGPPARKPNAARDDPCANKPAGAMGTAFMVDGRGHMVTNHHVIAHCRNDWPNVRFYVEFANGSRHDAQLVGSDELTDIAILRIAAPSIPAIPWVPSPPSDGENVVAIGYPFSGALRGDVTVTRGIVSGTNRSYMRHSDLVQTDAAVNPGNSGGPLVDMYGRVIGVNTEGFSPGGGSSGVNLAVSAWVAKTVAERITSQGGLRRARLGVNETFGLVSPDVRAFSPAGLVVQTVAPDSPAARATTGGGSAADRLVKPSVVNAIRPCDVIDLISGDASPPTGVLIGRSGSRIMRPIRAPGDLTNTLLAFRPGSEVTIDLRRPPADACSVETVEVGGQLHQVRRVRSLERATPMTVTVKLE